MNYSLKWRFSNFRKGVAEHPLRIFTSGISPGLLEVARKGLSNGYQLTVPQKTAYARRIANNHKGESGMRELLKLIGKTNDGEIQAIYAKRVRDFFAKAEKRLAPRATKAYEQGGKIRAEYDAKVYELQILANIAAELLKSGRLSDETKEIFRGVLLDL